MTRLLLVAFALLPTIAAAQGVAPPPKPVAIPFDIVTVGNFLGQLDGFCEQPGGTYDGDLLKKPLMQSCADNTGALKKGEWPVTLGGLLGAQTYINDIRKTASPLVLVQGNNQVANFTFVNKEQLLDSKVNYVASPEPLLISANIALQRGARFRRFWQEMAALKPTAIGLGQEDFVRSLREPLDQSVARAKDRGAIFQRWLFLVTGQGDPSQGVPLIGSNAVIKTNGKDVTVIKKDSFSLTGITEDQTTDWLTEVKVSHPKRAGIVLTLCETQLPGSTKDCVIDTKTTDGSTDSTTLEPEHGSLLPGVRYEVRVREGSKSFTLKFKTHHALTPRDHQTVANLNGFPVVVAPLTDQSSSVLVLSLVDPEVKKVIGAQAWKWDRKDCDAATAANGGCNWDKHLCPDEHCEIDFMKPEDAVKAAIVRAFQEERLKPGEKPADPPAQKPLIVLLSSLTDKQNQELLEQFPEIRILILDPDSYMLGRASRSLSKEDKGLEKRLAARDDEKQEYSGDRGLSATYNGNRSPATLLAARPEWIGESVARFNGMVTYSTAREWEMTKAKTDGNADREFVTVDPIPGAALQWKVGVPCPPPDPNAPKPAPRSRAQECTEFFMTWPDANTRVDYGPFASYEICDAPKPLPTETNPVDLADRCTMIASLKDHDEFAAFAGDALRRATGSELAVVPGLLIDPDAEAWLSPLIDKQHTAILTRFVLERAIFRSFRIVRATVSGDKLLATLEKSLKSERYIDSCIVGLTTGCTKTVDTKATDTTRVNARVIDSRTIYTIAMPEGMAEEFSLSRAQGEGHTTDAVSAIHQRLNTYDDGWYMPARDNTLSKRIERSANRKPQTSFLIAALEFGFEDNNVDSALNSGTLNSLDVEFRGADTERDWTGKLDGDWSVIDLEDFALRAVSQVDFKSRKIQPETGNETTYPTNTWVYGGRFDWKGSLGGRETRTYGGWFMDREFQGPRDFKTATIKADNIDGSATTTTAKARTLYKRKPIEYGYWAGGFEYLNISKPSWFFVDIKRLSAEYANGWLYHVPKGARIDTFTKEDFDDRITSPVDVLNAYFAQNPAAFKPAAILEAIDDQRRHQKRIQLEAAVERSATLGAHEIKGSAEVRYRRFPSTEDSKPNSLASYWRWKLDFTYKVASRIEFGPSFEWHHAKIMAPKEGQGAFKYSKVEIKLKWPFVIREGWGFLWK